MSHYDLTPLFRSSIGFDHMMQLLDSALNEGEATQPNSYPPYNIEKISDDTYRITMAVAGFKPDALNVVVQGNTLIIAGKIKEKPESITYLHKGIATRAFERHFQLADFIKIGEAKLEHGLLSVELTREIPEAEKPRKIPIQTTENSTKLLEHK